MSIDFDRERWERIKENTGKWWAGELDRPLLQIGVAGRDPGRPEPAIPAHSFTAFYDLEISAEQIVDRWDYDLSCCYYLGDGFPAVFPNFGPGVIAAFLGCTLVNGTDTVWFHPVEEKDIGDIHFEYDPENIWFNRIKDIAKAATERWEGLVQVSMTDLGGNLDIVSTFRPSDKLLLDLYDNPEEVRRLTWEAHEMWWRYFDEFNAVMQPTNPGYMAWSPVFSTKPFYMLQCDFAYMIGPDMFDEFVRPELQASCQRLSDSMYHLDGKGQLPHLDSLLSIPELNGIQWIPGDGAPDYRHWPEVYKKILGAGKLAQLYGGVDIVDSFAEQLGSLEGILFSLSANDESEARHCLRKYGVE